MSELERIIIDLEPQIEYREKFDSKFPQTNEYLTYVVDWVETHPRANWCNKNGKGLYDIIQQRERPFGNYNNATMSENGIYLFENQDKKIIYVGKGEVPSRIFNRVFDHVLPPHPDHPYKDYPTYQFTQQMQNTPEIWVEHLIKGEQIRIVLYSGITSFKGEEINKLSIIENYIYSKCYQKFGHRPYYNKKHP